MTVKPNGDNTVSLIVPAVIRWAAYLLGLLVVAAVLGGIAMYGETRAMRKSIQNIEGNVKANHDLVLGHIIGHGK